MIASSYNMEVVEIADASSDDWPGNETPLSAALLPDRVAAMLSRRISEGAIAPGTRLPTEQKLAALFGVSRNVVREAVARLRADGLVDARQGVGSFVLAPERRLAIRIDATTLGGEGMAQLFELRAILETEAARLAAARRTDAHLERIGAALERMRGEERWEEGSIDADLVFHREIAAATGNAFIETFVSFICERIRGSIRHARAINPIADLVDVNLGEHDKIYAALRSGAPDEAEAAMRAHLVGAAARVGVTLKR
ncbi:MAG: FadR/GntR family transcriptional regulator [Pikeienuella sp.]|uniref:FadR/GntR family transcriptional regulator n=1 Tax=Pikeienuella sp. TaxID=2831957 RepID=UPI00391897D7